jgi:hypothetical protein
MAEVSPLACSLTVLKFRLYNAELFQSYFGYAALVCFCSLILAFKHSQIGQCILNRLSLGTLKLEIVARSFSKRAAIPVRASPIRPAIFACSTSKMALE